MVAVEIDPVLAAALPATIATYAPDQADRFEVVEADAMRVTEVPGPPPTALVANLPYNVSVPVLLHLLALLPSLRHGLVMVQAEVADRLAAPPGLAHLRRAVGEGRLVRRRTTGRGRSAATCSGRRPTSTPGWSPGRTATRRPSTPRREEVFAVVDAAFAQRRKTLRSTLKQLAGSAEAAEAALAHAGVDPMARGESLGVAAVRADRRGPGAPVTVSADGDRRGDRARPRSTCRLGVGPARADGYHPLATVYQADRALRRGHGARRPDDVTRHRHRRRPASPVDDVPARRAPTSRSARPGCSPSTHGVDARRRDRTSTRASRSPAGMAGGSADAAATLLACDHAVGAAARPREELLELAAELGSDVPFALVGGTAIGTGRGELVTPLMTRGEYWWVVLESDDGPVHAGGLPRVRPADTAAPSTDPEIPDALMPRCAATTWPALGASLANDLQPAALRLRPELARRARAGPARVGARRARSPAPGRAACSCARAARTPSRSPPALRSAGLGPVSFAPGPGAGARVVADRRAAADMAPGQPGQPRARAQGLRRPARCSTTSASASARASGSASSAATATARPRCCGSSPASRSPTTAGSPATAACTSATSPRATTSTRPPPSARPCSRAAPTTSGPPTPRPARSSRCCSPGSPLDRVVDGLSGGERRRCSLARLLLGDHDLVVLDEPTNHLDVEAVAWLARHLGPRRTSALVVVTHDRWFLDAVCTTTWEVHDGVVDVYDGGYAAFVLAKAERQRQAAAVGGAAAEPGAQGARLAAPRRAGADLEAEVPDRRGRPR